MHTLFVYCYCISLSFVYILYIVIVVYCVLSLWQYNVNTILHLHRFSDVFSLTSFCEQWGLGTFHSFASGHTKALYLKAHVEKYANIDEWGDFLLNDSAHAVASRKITHNKFATELSKIANECGMATTCKESQLPYRDQGRPDQSRKRADMMTLSGGCVCENQRLNFNKITRLIMDVTIGHVFDSRHKFKRRNI